MQIISGMQAYAGLPHINDVARYSEERDGDLMRILGEVLVREGVHEICGIAYPLHYHLLLGANEVVVETTVGETTLARPVPALQTAAMYPGIIRFGDDGLIPLQWLAGVDEHKAQAEAFLASPAIATLRALTHPRTHHYGLARITEADRNVPDGYVWLEREVSGTLVKQLAPRAGDTSRTVQTIWHFDEAGGRVMARCNTNCSTDANGNHMSTHADL